MLVVGEVVGEFVAEVVGAVLVGAVLIVGEVVGEFVGEDVGAVLVEQCWLGYKIHSLWREVLEGWKGEEVREGTCS